MRAAGVFASLVLFAATSALAVPAWFPRDFSVRRDSSSAELSKYLDTHRLGIEPSLHRMGVAKAGNKEISCHAWIPAKARGTVFLVHGYYNHTGTWSPHIQRWVSDNFAVVAFDLPGHGLSDGRWMDIDSVAEYSQALRAVEDSMKGRVPLPWALVGHSLGGSVVLDRATRPEYPYVQSVLLAPLVHYAGWNKIGLAHPFAGLVTDRFARSRKIGSSADSVFRRRLVEDPLEGWQTGLSWLRAIRRWNDRIDTATWATSRWVLLQGDLDATVDVPYQNRWFSQRFGALATLRYPAARHHLHNESAPEGDRVRSSLDSILTCALPIVAK